MEHSPHNGQSGNITRPSSEFRSDWQVWSITALSLITIALLFRPWLTASGPYGEVQSDPFGRIGGSVPALGTPGVHTSDSVVSISGLWGVLTAAAAVAALFGAQLYRKFGIGLSLMLAGSLATVVTAPVTLLYLHAKAPEMREMTANRDAWKDALGAVLNSVLGGPESTTQQAAAGGLTTEALACGLVAVAMAGIASSIRRRKPVTIGDAAVAQEVSARVEADELPVTGHPVEEVRHQEVDDAVQHEGGLFVWSELIVDDTHTPVVGGGNQRLLSRTERLRRNENRLGQARRERNPARRRRSRPATGPSARSGRSATRGQCPATATTARPLVQR